MLRSSRFRALTSSSTRSVPRTSADACSVRIGLCESPKVARPVDVWGDDNFHAAELLPSTPDVVAIPRVSGVTKSALTPACPLRLAR